MTSTIQTLAEHTVDVSLLPENAIVLDGGCRGYGFSRQILKVRPNATVIAVDADEDTEPSNHSNIKLLRVAIVGKETQKFARYAAFDSGNGNSIVFPGPPRAELRMVPCMTLEAIMRKLNLAKWDLVKLDIEGSEFDVLENWPGPIASQITVEFHDYFDKEGRWDSEYFKKLLAGPLKDYEVVQNEYYAIGDRCFGHWDSLFRQKTI